MENAMEVIDKLSRPKLKILSTIDLKGLTAAEASEMLDISQPSVLRDLRELERMDLLTSKIEKGEIGPPRSRFFPKKFELTIKINDGKFDATLKFK